MLKDWTLIQAVSLSPTARLEVYAMQANDPLKLSVRFALQIENEPDALEIEREVAALLLQGAQAAAANLQTP